MSRVLAAIEEDGSRAFRVFPRESGVLLAFAERVAGDVVSSSCIVRGQAMPTRWYGSYRNTFPPCLPAHGHSVYPFSCQQRPHALERRSESSMAFS